MFLIARTGYISQDAINIRDSRYLYKILNIDYIIVNISFYRKNI